MLSIKLGRYVHSICVIIIKDVHKAFQCCLHSNENGSVLEKSEGSSCSVKSVTGICQNEKPLLFGTTMQVSSEVSG